MRKKCVVCGKFFQFIKRNQRFCSGSCRTYFFNAKKKYARPLHVRECVVCSSVFQTRKNDKLTCSTVCSADLKRYRTSLWNRANNDRSGFLAKRRAHARNPNGAYIGTIRNCIQCRTDFAITNPAQICCSSECSQFNLNNLKRKYYHRDIVKMREKSRLRMAQLTASYRLVRELESGIIGFFSEPKPRYKTTSAHRAKQREYYQVTKHRRQTAEYRSREKEYIKYNNAKRQAALKLVRELEKNSIGALLP